MELTVEEKERDEQITKLVLEESNELEKFLNDDLLPRFASLHNIKPAYNRFSLKQEIVARSAFLLPVKKHYALNITNQEGVPVDEMEIKGLVTQRSDYPSYSKQKIRELLELLVSINFDKKKIRELVETEEKNIRTMCEYGLPTIARPVSYSKNKKEYKKIPIQIIGMDLWNELEYNWFVPGTRGYLFKILGIDFDKAPEKICMKEDKLKKTKMQYIVLPMEEERLPPYYIIDVEAMFKFAWADRVTELTDVVKSKIYNVPSDPNDGVLIWD